MDYGKMVETMSYVARSTMTREERAKIRAELSDKLFINCYTFAILTNRWEALEFEKCIRDLAEVANTGVVGDLYSHEMMRKILIAMNIMVNGTTLDNSKVELPYREILLTACLNELDNRITKEEPDIKVKAVTFGARLSDTQDNTTEDESKVDLINKINNITRVTQPGYCWYGDNTLCMERKLGSSYKLMHNFVGEYIEWLIEIQRLFKVVESDKPIYTNSDLFYLIGDKGCQVSNIKIDNEELRRLEKDIVISALTYIAGLMKELADSLALKSDCKAYLPFSTAQIVAWQEINSYSKGKVVEELIKRPRKFLFLIEAYAQETVLNEGVKFLQTIPISIAPSLKTINKYMAYQISQQGNELEKRLLEEDNVEIYEFPLM